MIIGRNEGMRLSASLASASALDGPLIYVDSASTDDSLAIARRIADVVIELGAGNSLSAARARNAGLAELRLRWPEISFVLFLDGDCILDRGFSELAISALSADERRAIVVGHLTEAAPNRSIYNRLCAIEWHSPPAEQLHPARLGGIMMACIEDIVAIGGFNEQIIAGEDTELGVRLTLAGKIITKIDAPMATHDADIRHFSQWWRRAVRAGHAIGQRYSVNGRTEARDCARELRSTLVWGLIAPAAAALGAVPTRGLSVLLLAAYPLIGLRVYRHLRSTGATPEDAFLGARFGIYSKFANATGLVQFVLNRMRGHYQIIEYK